MKREDVLSQLDGIGIRREADYAVPINGAQIQLPYQVVRTRETIDGSDNGRAQLLKIEWTVALFTANKNPALERAISRALCGVGKVKITYFPDGTPYQTNFEFTTREIMKQENEQYVK